MMHFFDEIKSYVGFTDEDAARLKALGPLVEPRFSEVVVAFYDALMAHPRARGVFVGPEQIDRLRASLAVWLGELFEGRYDDAYFAHRQHIGRVHVNVGLLPQFMFGAMNLIRHGFLEILSDLEARLQSDPRIQSLRHSVTSVDRILDIELTIMVQSYWDSLMKQKLEIPAALATGLAHEVRNPLNAIGLQMTLLERRLRSSEVDEGVYGQVLEAVRAELRRIQGLNSEILDFAKPVDIHTGPVDVAGMFYEIRRNHELTLEAGGVQMDIEVEGDPVMICDRDRLMQVFINLMTNAVEAMPDGGLMRVQVVQSESGLRVEFGDSGQGMSPAMKYRIFDLFYTSKASGTGIGLAIARKIVEAHGGSIDVLSRPGEGTTFTVYLPYPRRDAEDEVER
ncbi:hypothetical protein FRC91_14955 [Bradymonadales bacterium TMQ1]|uniref:histidine kinase n=2 Tax=Lujinxingia sediminis TaxID=2480984 RepID=A0ABY0CW10_9DELT|nr:hypothetical protein EA187_06820 [Lujinxingia sediminis]TXC74848.1 hypothetical protein FRC91_14955 [Bradymonadales bacterium TMQ1]